MKDWPADPRYWLVAHRGHASRFPENTWSALKAAAACGLVHLEFDVQLTADGVPFVIHDDDLERTTSNRGLITRSRSASLENCHAGYPSVFGNAFTGEKLCRLADLATKLKSFEHVAPLVEIKPQSVATAGVETAVSAVFEGLGELLGRSTIISFDWTTVKYAQGEGASRTGWCIQAYDEATRQAALSLSPDLLLIDYRELPPARQAIWMGSWDWACWEVTEPALALQLRDRGVRFVETMACEEMLAALHARDVAG